MGGPWGHGRVINMVGHGRAINIFGHESVINVLDHGMAINIFGHGHKYLKLLGSLGAGKLVDRATWAIGATLGLGEPILLSTLSGNFNFGHF